MRPHNQYNKQAAMKLSSSTILLAITSSTYAFSPMAPASTTTKALHSEATPEMMEEEPTPEEPKMSQSLPFMPQPTALDGTMPGDVGFDPLGFAKDVPTLQKMREAEVRHARLAMLAAAGWPLSELFNAKIASTTGLVSTLNSADRVPSVLNGGLGKVPTAYWALVFLATAGIEGYTLLKAKSSSDYFPGKLGFDPLGLYGSDTAARQRMELAEIKNGRLAMIAITAFAFQEFVSKVGVVDETPFFFKPVGSAMHEYANQGYIMH